MPAYTMNEMNTMLNAAGTTSRQFSDTGIYGMLQNTYTISNLIGFKATTPGSSGYVYTTFPTAATCYLTVYGDGNIYITNGTTVQWFYLFGSGYNGNAYEVYCQTGSGFGSVYGDTRDAWITIGTYKQWYITTTGFADRYLYLYFRNTYFPQTAYGTFYLYAESLI